MVGLDLGAHTTVAALATSDDAPPELLRINGSPIVSSAAVIVPDGEGGVTISCTAGGAAPPAAGGKAVVACKLLVGRSNVNEVPPPVVQALKAGGVRLVTAVGQGGVQKLVLRMQDPEGRPIDTDPCEVIHAHLASVLDECVQRSGFREQADDLRLCITTPNNFALPVKAAYESAVARLYPRARVTFVCEVFAAFASSFELSNFGALADGEARHVLMVDVGHGTVDGALFEVSRTAQEAKLEVLHSFCDSACAGMSQTHAVRTCMDDILTQAFRDDPSLYAYVNWYSTQEAESMKTAICDHFSKGGSVGDFKIASADSPPKRTFKAAQRRDFNREFKATVSRAEAEALMQPSNQQLARVVTSAMAKMQTTAGDPLDPSRISVIVVGGGSRGLGVMSSIRQATAGCSHMSVADRQTSAAHGAALLLQHAERRPMASDTHALRVRLVHVRTTTSFGLVYQDKRGDAPVARVARLVPANAVLPAEGRVGVELFADDMRPTSAGWEMDLDVVQGVFEDRAAKDALGPDVVTYRVKATAAENLQDRRFQVGMRIDAAGTIASLDMSIADSRSTADLALAPP